MHWKMKLNWAELMKTNKVAAHFTPLIGKYESADPNVIEYHLKLMQAAGVRGIIINWYGASNINDFPGNRLASDVIVELASELGMKFTICYEDWTTLPDLGWNKVPNAEQLEAGLAQMKLDFEYIRDKYMTKPGFLRQNDAGATDRPFWLVFGPRTITNKDNWMSLLSETFPDLQKRPLIISLSHRNGFDGKFSWFPLKRGEKTTLEDVHRYLDDFYQDNKGSFHIGTIFPGFHDYYVEGSLGEDSSYGRLPEYNGKTFEASIYQAKEHMPNFVQAATWNDFQEGTVFEPAIERGIEYKSVYYFLMKIQSKTFGSVNEEAFIQIHKEFMEKRTLVED